MLQTFNGWHNENRKSPLHYFQILIWEKKTKPFTSFSIERKELISPCQVLYLRWFLVYTFLNRTPYSLTCPHTPGVSNSSLFGTQKQILYVRCVVWMIVAEPPLASSMGERNKKQCTNASSHLTIPFCV